MAAEEGSVGEDVRAEGLIALGPDLVGGDFSHYLVYVAGPLAGAGGGRDRVRPSRPRRGRLRVGSRTGWVVHRGPRDRASGLTRPHRADPTTPKERR